MSEDKTHKSVLQLLPIYLKRLPQSQKKQFYFALFCSIVSVFLDLFGVGILLQMVVMMLGKNLEVAIIPMELLPLNNIAGVALLALFFIVKSGLSIYIQKIILKIIYAIGRQATLDEAEAVLSGKIDFNNTSSSHQITRLFNLAFYLPDAILTAFFQLIAESLIGFLVVFMAWWITGNSLLIVLGVLLPPITVIFYFIRIRIRKNGEQINATSPMLYRSINDIVHGSIDINLAQKQAHFLERIASYTNKVQQHKSSTALLGTQVTLRVVEVTVALALLVFVFLQQVIFKNGTDTLLQLSVFGVLAFRILPSLNRILGALNQLNNFAFVLEQLAENNKSKTALRNSNKVVFEQLQVLGLTFGYAGQSVLWGNLNFSLKKGDILGISGPSGCGKSTLLKVLCGFEGSFSGEMVLNDTLICKNGLVDCVSLSFVKQEVYLIQGTIAQNIAMSYDTQWKDEAIIKALEQAELYNWAKQLPLGINTQVGELGNLISGGQKQRLAIARALYHQAELLLFDEATRALDEESEQSILLTLKELANAGKTIIIVSHSPQVLAYCNSIVELKKEN
jgi:ABC-type bacteriocin/lantibiotic exporter with double-glycine peptidase domain